MPATEGNDVGDDVVASFSYRVDVMTIQGSKAAILVQKPIQADTVTRPRLCCGFRIHDTDMPSSWGKVR
jgi:hypothetical protein